MPMIRVSELKCIASTSSSKHVHIFKHIVFVCECDTKYVSGLIDNVYWQMEYT
jgi:hypothetical protein